MKSGPRVAWTVSAFWLCAACATCAACAACAACAQGGERAQARSAASSQAEEAPARPIATSLANDPLQEAPPPAPAHQHHHHQGAADSAQHICPMHPEVQQAGPGECPKCGMKLVPKPTSAAEPAHEHAN
ncbi:MAG TPA: heavy metal-binding domain-containing protein [Polyangiales bacterium]|nr:heavy metal-binding domain-containing protein [Polyangiales bacterium]